MLIRTDSERKVKKIITSIIMISYLIPCIVIHRPCNAYGADTSITLDSSATGFVCIEDDTQFIDMEPAETREAKIRISNNSGYLMDFYINGQILDNIADSPDSDKCAIYRIQLYKDGENIPFYDGITGSGDYKKYASENNMADTFLTQDVKLATLNNDEDSVIKLVVTLDGLSFNNSYMEKTGKLRLNISATQGDNTISQSNPDKIINSENRVQTGDDNNTRLYVGVIILCVGIIAIDTVIIRSGKKNNSISHINDKKEINS